MSLLSFKGRAPSEAQSDSHSAWLNLDFSHFWKDKNSKCLQTMLFSAEVVVDDSFH